MKKRIKLGDTGSGEPVISLLGAEDLLALSDENDASFKQVKPESIRKYDFSMDSRPLVCLCPRVRNRSRIL